MGHKLIQLSSRIICRLTYNFIHDCKNDEVDNYIKLERAVQMLEMPILLEEDKEEHKKRSDNLQKLGEKQIPSKLSISKIEFIHVGPLEAPIIEISGSHYDIIDEQISILRDAARKEFHSLRDISEDWYA